MGSVADMPVVWDRSDAIGGCPSFTCRVAMTEVCVYVEILDIFQGQKIKFCQFNLDGHVQDTRGAISRNVYTCEENV